MGKLHTLRRAIKRNPERWEATPWGKAHSAYFWNGEWCPSWGMRGPYQAFVQHVLDEIKNDQEAIGSADGYTVMG